MTEVKMDDTHNLVNADTTGKSDTNYFDILINKFQTNTTGEIQEPPQLEGSTVDDWLEFFINNGFIFIVWLMGMVWVCYAIYYHSRLIGYILTKIINYLFIKNGYFKMGSFTFASISGKVMFRDLVYVTEDYSLRIQDGVMIFSYWLPYVFRNAKTEDLSNCDARVQFILNGFELHIYNRSNVYSELEKIFNLPSRIFGDSESNKEKEVDLKKQADEERRQKILKTMNESAAVNELKQSIWRDLFPATKIEITSGRFVFGNPHMPSTLSITFEDFQFHYTSRPAVSSYDLFTHILKGKAENMQVGLVPTPKYTGYVNDEPPRIMGDGFIVFRTNKIDIYYYQDEPGLITDETMNELDNSPPAWGMVIKTGKGTDFSYGPWADRQRDYLYNFFYPPTYQMVEVSEKPKVGELRRFESFDVRLSTLSDAKIDILFSKNKETKALHLNAGPGTYLEASIPWICGETGYTSHILGQILHLEATTSLQFRHFVSSETLEIDLKIFYPRFWNGQQDWNCKITACKATIDLIFAHKIFLVDLIDDWSDKNRPDILKFIPYTWRISVVIKEFELIVLANEHNWIDCSTGVNDENCKIAICGEHFDMAFDLPFIEFLPPKLAIKIWIQGECLEGAFYLPECSINRDVIELLQLYSNIMCRDGNKKPYLEIFGQSRKWKNMVSRENHWYECMSAPIVALSITYDYWPMPPITTNEIKDSEVTTPELEEILLSPLRPSSRGSQGFKRQTASESFDFDPTSLAPDVMTVELEIGPMNLAIFGALFMFLWNIKENYLGESQVFSEMSASFFDDKFEQNVKKRSETATSERKDKNIVEAAESEQQLTPAPFDTRLYRPFEVIVSVTLHEIQGHLVQCSNQPELYAPLVYVEKLCFELQKGFTETKLQLIISPAVVQVDDALERASPINDAWKEGFLTLSSLQFRGHAMFSNLDRPIESETLEYAWLVEVEVGEISGRLTLDHLRQILIPLENFFFQILQSDIGLQPPNPFKKCLHDLLQNECAQSDVSTNRFCPYSEDVKYRMVRVIVNQIDIFLLESNVALNVVVPTVKLATCNLHIEEAIDGFSLLVTNATIRQFVTLAQVAEKSGSECNWLEISSISTGPLFIDAALSSSSVDNYAVSQIDFIKRHDTATKRLWFLWNEKHRRKCGCIGNVTFFGCNLVGLDFFAFTLPPTAKEKGKCMGAHLHDHSLVFNPGYGESLLHPNNFLLDINSPLMDETSKAILNTSKYTDNKSSHSLFSKQKSPSALRLNLRPTTLTTKGDGMKNSVSTFETTFSTSPIESTGSRQMKPSVSSSERFFSAEDLSNMNPMHASLKTAHSNKTDLDAESLTASYKTIPNGDNGVFSSPSDTWASPLSADDITSPSRYFTAMGGKTGLTSSQRHISTNTSNATLGRFQSLSSDSSPTLVSVENDFSRKDDQTSSSTTYRNKLPVDGADRRSSMTLSTNSFISAVSEHEDLDLVDLRNQLEKPIFDSPLLMSTYSVYMSAYGSQHLDIPPPFPLLQNARLTAYFGMKSAQVLHFERLLYEYRHEWKPKFVLRKIGFSETKILSKNAIVDTLDEEKFYSTYFVPGIVSSKSTIQRAKDVNFLNDNEVLFSQRKPTVTFNEPSRSRSGTTAKDDVEVKARAETLIDLNILGSSLVREREDSVDNIQVYIQFREIELKLSPVTLDVTAKFVTSFDQIINSMHPGSLLNHLSLAAQNAVEEKNSLKKEKLLYLGQLHMRAWKVLKQRQSNKHINRSISFSDRASRTVHEGQGHANTLVSNNLEFDKKLSLNLTVEIARININSIQASIVEEIISFSALDRVKDLTCVSVLNLSLGAIDFKLSRSFRRRKILHILMDQSSVNSLSFTEKALMTRFFTRKPKKVYSEIETSVYETTDAFIDEMTTNISLRHIHLQLSRLVNSSDVLKGAVLTVIPYTKTKVDFVYAGPNLEEYGGSVKLKRRKYIKTVMQNTASTSSTSSSRKNLLMRQSCVVPDGEVSKEGENAKDSEMSTSQISSTSAASSTNVKMSDSTEEQPFAHFNRFIMFEAGLEKLTVTFSNSSTCNAVKLKIGAPNVLLSTSRQNLSASTSNLSSDLEVIDIPSKPVGSSTVKGEIAKVWFHFASPPKMSANPYKNEFTRHDWHLLSSAVPLTIAWVSAIDRMAYTYSSAERHARQRMISTVACLMSKTLNDYLQAKDAQLIKPLHSNSKQLTRIFSSMAKTFQEDPSIHMINVLRANLKNSFTENGDFENYFGDPSLIPNLKELEKGIIVLLHEWKDLIHIPASNVHSMFYRMQTGQQPPSKKNQIIAILEEKTRQLNLAMTNIGGQHDSAMKATSSVTAGGGDLGSTPRARLFTATGVADNDSMVLSQVEGDTETSKLLRRPLHPTEGYSDSHMADLENRAENLSNVTRNTASDVDSKRTRLNSQRRSNRVQFMSSSHARAVYEQFIGLPIVRNLSTVCHNSVSGISNSFNRLRQRVNNQPSTGAHDLTELQTLDLSVPNNDSYSAPNSPKERNAGKSPLEGKISPDESAAAVPPLDEVHLTVPDFEDVTGHMNGRCSSHSNFAEGKKDFYWWMMKQDYRTTWNTMTSTVRDYTNRNVHYFNLNEPEGGDPGRGVNLVEAATETAGAITTSATPGITKEDEEGETQEDGSQKDGEASTKKTEEEAAAAASAFENKAALDSEVSITFEPLIKILALENAFELDKLTIPDFGLLGTKILLSVNIRQLCIDIDEADTDMNRNMFTQAKINLMHFGCAQYSADNLSAFVCDNLAIETVLLKKTSLHSNDLVANHLKEFETHSKIGLSNMSTNIAHILQEMKKSQTDENNVLNLESAFIVGFGIQLGQVIQRINLPLLRLVHQFSAMYENVVQTRFEMRSNRTTYTQNDLDANNREEGDDFSLNSLSTVTSVSSDDSLSISADLPPVRPPRGRKAEEFVITIESPTDEKVVAFPETTTTTAGQLPTTTSATRAPGSEPKSSIDSFTQVEKCWRTVYFLLDQHRRNRVQMYLNSSSAFSNKNAVAHLLNQPESTEANSNTVYLMYPNLDLFGGCPVIVAGSGLVKRMNLVAMLSTLKLDGDLTNFSFSLTHQGSSRRERPKPAVTFSPVVHLKNILTTSFEVNLEKTKISLYEDTLMSVLEPSTSSSQPQQQLVVEMVIGQSNFGLSHKNETEREFAPTLEQLSNYDTFQVNSTESDSASGSRSSKRKKFTNSARVVIGAIEIDIPQHPVALHGMMTRSGRQLSTTLQELRSSRQPSRMSRQQTMTHSNTGNMATDSQVPPSPLAPASSMSSSTHQSSDHGPHGTLSQTLSSTPKVLPLNRSQEAAGHPLGRHRPPSSSKPHSVYIKDRSATDLHGQSAKFTPEQQPEQQLLLPFLVDFSVILESFTIKASLLPSLRAQYRIGQVTSTGFTGSKAKFTIDVNHHSLCFNTKIEPGINTDINLPTEASINLPGIHINAEYLEESTKKPVTTGIPTNVAGRSESFTDGIVFRKGSYLNMIAEIGAFEHCLTTDLLNHLLFVQKVFMKEINEIVQKMYRTDANNFIILQDSLYKSDYDGEQFDMDKLGKQLGSESSRVILFSLHLRMTGIQITATTPTNSAVRFETGTIDLHLSNRVMNVSLKRDLNLKVFLRVQLDFNLALGQLIRNAMFEEAEPDFQQLAYFKTRINMRNALKDEMLSAGTPNGEESEEDKEVVLITLTRPLVYVQPLALDKAVLVWINYKNAYEYWNEQRSNLNSEVIQATQQVFDRVHPLTQSLSSSQSLGTLFLQLNVNDFGICLPISSSVINFPNQTRIFDSDLKDALVLTLESTRISACSRGSLVSKAQFNNLCIRFADDFETNLDDWKPNLADASIKNLCIVSEGTYEICSRTITHQNHFHQKDNISSLPEHLKAQMPSADEESVADAKWILNVSWKMDGFDIHVDTSIGKHISALFKTMTAIAGDEDDEDDQTDEEEEDEDEDDDQEENMIQDNLTVNKTGDTVDALKKETAAVPGGSMNDLTSTRPKILIASRSIDDSVSERKNLDPELVNDSARDKRWSAMPSEEATISESKTNIIRKSRSTTIKDAKELNKRRSRNIEKELNEQAKVINDLRQLGASHHTITRETQRYQELEAAAFNHFRRGVIKKLKRPSKSSSMGVPKDFSKSRAYSTSLYSYDEAKLPPSGQTHGEMHTSDKRPVTEEEFTNGKVPLGKIRSSTISIPHLKYDDNSSLVTLSSGDETSSYTENEASPPLSPDSVGNQSFSFSAGRNSKQSESERQTSQTATPGKERRELPKGGDPSAPLGFIQGASALPFEPKIDFELDVKIFFNSGKCVLHTKDQATKDAEMAMNAARNYSATDMAANANNSTAAAAAAPSSISPTLSANHSQKANSLLPSSIIKSRSAHKLSKFYGYGHSAFRRDYNQSAGMNPDFTVFLIPGLDIKLHYTSKSINPSTEEDKDKEQAHFRNPNLPQEKKLPKTETPGSANNSLSRQKCTKKAFLFAWITLSSIPDEIFISPHILDFFEEALKPIPITVSGPTSKNATLSSIQSGRHQRLMAASASSDPSNLADTPAQYVYYASFPVDVIVFFHFQPTIIRLGCLPVSRVECLLHLPSIDLVISSKRSDFDLDMGADSPSTPQSLQQLSSKTFKNLNKSSSSDSPAGTIATGGGLSITGCLADFSLYIFHPYGGQKNKASLGDRSSNKPKGSYSTSDRKDSLSLQVEFVKINISRSRKVILGDSLTQSISFSAICDIGTATFKYDVRRLNEILAFPKAWYRKSIWKKIFIGENTVNAIFSDEEDIDPELGSSHHRKGKDAKENDYLNGSCSSSSTTSLSNEFSLDSSAELKKSATRKSLGKKRKIKAHMIAIVNNPWETLVLLTVNFSNLNISMNMGNVMGNANWLTRNLMCDGSISIDSSGHRKFRFGIGLKNSTLDAKGGIVGGIVELSDIRTEINVREDRDREPQHRISISLHTVENRIDYMGTSILMVRISDLSASFHDEWRVMAAQFDVGGGPARPTNTEHPRPQSPSTASFPTKRPASIYMHGCLKWDQMQVLMSKSTSPDFTKIISKLEEFFTQQFHSGKRVFDSLHPSSKNISSSGQSLAHRDSMRGKSKRTQSVSSSNSGGANLTEAAKAAAEAGGTPLEHLEPVISHHRHWQRALQFVTGVYHTSLTEPPLLTQHGIILGGTIEVRAQNISLACFYGVNFRSKSWAVFSLKQPSITFMTEAQHVKSEDSEESAEFSTHVVQNLSLQLGRHRSSGPDSNPSDLNSRTMATVCKISRAVVFPPQFRHLHEWFHYAFSPVEIDEVARFPLPSPDNAEFDAYGVPIESLTSTPSQLRNNQAAADRRTKTASEFHYKEEMIFAFPSMQLELKTDHLQGAKEPLLTDAKPQVLCSFVSDFDDHIYVAVDAEAYFFLHDLILSYINESTTTTTTTSSGDSFSKNDRKEGAKVSKAKAEKGKADGETGGKESKALALTEKRKSEEDLGKDFREFICKVWHLEPTVRLHSWASKNIDPYGVDYILQRLGFSQARTTIPKWIQRSTMDGIDKLLSLFVYRMILKSQEDNPKSPQFNSGQKE